MEDEQMIAGVFLIIKEDVVPAGNGIFEVFGNPFRVLCIVIFGDNLDFLTVIGNCVY